MKKTALVLIFCFFAAACTVPVPGGSSQPQPPDPPRITFSKPVGEKTRGGMYVLHFEVTNYSGRTLERVKVHCSFYDEDGRMIGSESPYIDLDPLEAQETSAAAVRTRTAFASYRLQFTARGEQPWDRITLDATEAKP